jgi:hypothetical protein
MDRKERIVAAVKTQRGGPRKEPVFSATKCAGCNGDLNALKDAWRVKSIFWVNEKRRSRFNWFHRACVK